MIASSRLDEGTFKLLLSAGAEINVTNNDGWTALMKAAADNKPENLKLLLEAGADPNMRNDNGWTALGLAGRNGHTETVDILKEAGAKE